MMLLIHETKLEKVLYLIIIGFIKGAYWIPKRGAMMTWLSNLLPIQTPLLIFCEKGQFEEIANRLFRFGYFNVLGFNNFLIEDWQGPIDTPKLVNL